MTPSSMHRHDGFPSRLLWGLVLLLSGALFGLRASAADDFRPLLEDAVRKGAPEVVIPPGAYRLEPQGNIFVVVKDAKNLHIIANGVTVICSVLTRAVEFRDCQNVTLQGLTVDYDPLPFTQGTVTKIAGDFSSVDIDLDDGYPREPYSRIDLCDPATHYRKRGMPFLWNTRAEMIGEKTVRVTLKDIGKAAKIGDLASLSTGPADRKVPHAISVDNCSGMVFDHVTAFTAPGFGMVESDGEGGMKYTHCRVVPGPIPPGATKKRLLSSTWDGMQTKTLKHGPQVEHCEIASAGDDSWSVQSSDFVITSVNGARAVISFRDEYCAGPQVGDHLAKSLGSPTATITAVRGVDLFKTDLNDDIRAKMKTAPNPWDYWHLNARAAEITVDGPFPFAVGDSVYDIDRQCNGFIFSHNRLHSSGRILVKASDGVIEDNEVLEGHSGLTISPEVPAEAAVGIRNLVIRGNHFTGTGYFCPLWSSPQAGAVSVSTDGPGGHFRPPGLFQNIVIEENRFDDICGPSIVVTSTQGVTIQKNIFCRVMTAKPDDTGGRYNIDPLALIWLGQCEQVKVDGNLVYQPGTFLKETVAGMNLDAALLQQAKAGVDIKAGAKCPALDRAMCQ